jgi:hypothetical protein
MRFVDTFLRIIITFGSSNCGFHGRCKAACIVEQNAFSCRFARVKEKKSLQPFATSDANIIPLTQMLTPGLTHPEEHKSQPSL